ncbi:MAG: 4Fe-4S binding protein [Proteobacteria bacterium]|nr:4Fe-4S binding protein [Pseudomonadota bacterium]MBU4469235.1 4Fe-4S binding protein [Pseudomonadota bacterium]MCG2752266.1 4Fe-4S binding protein [Desulfobacteraceae bacterium]
MESLRYLEGVSTLELNSALCVGCGLCTKVCPHHVFEMADGKAEIVDIDACMECGACVNNCPVNAVSVHPGVG